MLCPCTITIYDLCAKMLNNSQIRDRSVSPKFVEEESAVFVMLRIRRADIMDIYLSIVLSVSVFVMITLGNN
jgi:hypothetical protein